MKSNLIILLRPHLSMRIFLTFLLVLLIPSPGATAKPAGKKQTNLALHRAAYHSSCINYDNTGHLVTDGIILSGKETDARGSDKDRFSSKWVSLASDPQWIYVDLGASCSIDKVKLYWDNDYATAYKIEVSNDLSAWKTVYSTNSGNGGTDEIAFLETQARYVRMFGTARNSTGGYALSEFEVYGTGGISPKPLPQPALENGILNLTGGNWKLQRASFVQATGVQISQPAFDDNSWIMATVPGTVLTSYLNIGAIPDPDFGDQQLQISDAFFTADFWYRYSFVVPQSYQGKKVWINFDGINWKADVFVNGNAVGNIKGAFIRGKFDLTPYVKAGKTNYLAVLIHKNDTPGQVTLQSFSGAGKNGGVLGADNPTIHASVGWDWIPTIRGRNTGIQDKVYLSESGDVSIVDPFIITTLPLPDTTSADIRLKVNLRNDATHAVNGKLTGTITPGNISFSRDISLNGVGISEITLSEKDFAQLKVTNPKLWWPNGYGVQNMYSLNLAFEINGQVSDKKDIPFGIRQVTTDTTNHVLTIFVNGRRILMRGGNWGMSESMLRLDKEGYDVRVRLHKEENFTMIRNWVGMTGDENFYHACDKYGILIWDDFWLANPADGPIPNDPEMFMKNAEDKIRRVRNHPSVVLYCARNEGYPPASLADNLVKATTVLDGTRPYIPHSAIGLVSGFGPYSVQNPKWYFQNRSGKKIHSEMGMPNMPSAESMRQMLPADKLWPINDMWGVHDFCAKSAQGADVFIRNINNSYGEASGLDDFCRKAQMVNMENHKAMFEPFAGARGNGVLLWMSQSAWPSTVWQTYDYYLEQNAGYFGCKKGCEPLHILWDCNSDAIKVSNNTNKNYPHLVAEAKIFNLDGTEKYTKSVTIDASLDSVVNCFTVQFPADLSPVHFLRLKLMDGNHVLSDNFYWRGNAYQDYNALSSMNKVSLAGSASIKDNGNKKMVMAVVSNKNNGVALMIRLKLLNGASGERVLPAFYSDNYFSLLPNETKTVTIEADTRDMGNETPKLFVEGWNINPGQVEVKLQ